MSLVEAEMLLFPSAIGILTERVLTTGFFAGNKSKWREESIKLNRNARKIFNDLQPDATPQEKILKFVKDVHQDQAILTSEAAARLAWFKLGITGVAVLGTIANLRSRDYFHAYAAAAIGVPYLVGGVLDAYRAGKYIFLHPF